MSYTYETINYRGFEIEIKSDEDPQNPRTDWDNAGTMVCWHRRYNLGDMEKVSKNNYQPVSKNYNEPIDLLYNLAGVDRDEYLETHDDDMPMPDLYRFIEEKGTIITMLFLYDHSGLAMSCSSFNGRAQHAEWDSGPVGFIYMTKETMEKEGWTKEQAEKYLEGQVETYDDYLQGNVYGYDIEAIGKSCYGYYGSPKDSGVIEEAKGMVDAHIRHEIKRHLQKVKSWILNKVPVIYRTPLQLGV